MKKFLLLLTFVALASEAFAQNSFIIPGSRPGTDSGIVSYSSGSTFQTRVLKDRSVYCRYRGGIGADWGLSSTIGCLVGGCPTGRLVGDAEHGIDSIFGPDDAIAFISDDNDRYDISIVSVSPDPSNLIVECFNTTLYGNFNTVTAANPFNFLELSNDSNLDITTLVVVTKNDGTELSRTNISVLAGQQRDISVHDIAGASNTFGRILVSHDGALHGLRANITKYTSSFVITAATPLATRGNEQ